MANRDLEGPVESTPALGRVKTKRKERTKEPGRSESIASTSTTRTTTTSRKVRARSSGGSSRGTHASRRPTLDEELEDAFRRQSDSYDEHLLESGVFTGVGTRSKKKGFLARGGAGGEPVFMGEGYVEGVEIGEGENDQGDDRRRRSRRVR